MFVVMVILILNCTFYFTGRVTSDGLSLAMAGATRLIFLNPGISLYEYNCDQIWKKKSLAKEKGFPNGSNGSGLAIYSAQGHMT